jgi:hypothetical protein
MTEGDVLVDMMGGNIATQLYSGRLDLKDSCWSLIMFRRLTLKLVAGPVIGYTIIQPAFQSVLQRTVWSLALISTRNSSQHLLLVTCCLRADYMKNIAIRS